ncbi:MAG: biliverdin-producing heme oxygenase [Pseudobdellovibrionaceae bacterium]|nr:biliverdin-producing heme oxygenase [Pseudobdellovibrionaceae bacterium]
MILNRLRLETSPHHERLDHHPLMVQLMSPQVSRQHYQHIIGKFFGFYQVLEPLLARRTMWPDLGIDFSERLKTPWILQDLTYLDVPIARLAHAPTPDWLQDDASALGAFYVLEGSTLGGQVIARHVTDTLHLNPEQGLAFFSSYGAQVGQRWKETRKALMQFSENSGADDVMIQAAKNSFLDLTTWLDT